MNSDGFHWNILDLPAFQLPDATFKADDGNYVAKITVRPKI